MLKDWKVRCNEEDALISRQFAETQMHQRIAICNPDEGHGLEKSGGGGMLQLTEMIVSNLTRSNWGKVEHRRNRASEVVPAPFFLLPLPPSHSRLFRGGEILTFW